MPRASKPFRTPRIASNASASSAAAGRGADTVIEAVGVAATFELCQLLVAAGGTIANVGVHGAKADLHLERLWSHNITITTRLVDTVSTPQLLRMVEAKQLDPEQLVTHHFAMTDMMDAYDVFSRAAETQALKVIIEAADPAAARSAA